MRYITLTPSNVGSATPLAGLDWMMSKVILSAHRNPSYHYSIRPSKRTGPSVKRRLLGAVPRYGVGRSGNVWVFL
jgi:hypothetical protein